MTSLSIQCSAGSNRHMVWHKEYVAGVRKNSLWVFKSRDGRILRTVAGVSSAVANMIAGQLTSEIVQEEERIFTGLDRLCHSLVDGLLEEADCGDCDQSPSSAVASEKRPP